MPPKYSLTSAPHGAGESELASREALKIKLPAGLSFSSPPQGFQAESAPGGQEERWDGVLGCGMLLKTRDPLYRSKGVDSV